eukprot:g22175.t1
MASRSRTALRLGLSLLGLSRCGLGFETGEVPSELESYVTDPIARHTACAVDANTATVCVLEGFVSQATTLEWPGP